MHKNSYIENGVIATPSTPSFGRKVTLTYNGLLPRSGASEVYAHVGYGCDWKDSYDYKMTRTNNGFETTIPVCASEDLNVCFKDPLNNWDNNHGHNYSFKVME